MEGNLGAARIFSTALETIKFLSDTSPIIGFSSFNGTGTFLAPGLAYLEAISYTNLSTLIQITKNKMKPQSRVYYHQVINLMNIVSRLTGFVLKIKYLRSSNFIVPVPFNLNWEAFGLAVPFGNPNEAPLATV